MRPAGRSQLVVGMILAWSVIYVIHVFVFPVYPGAVIGGGGGGGGGGGSLAALESALCGRRVAARRLASAASARCPPAGIATAHPSGRTGNLISEYASLWAVARRTGLEAYAPPCLLAPLRRLFANLTLASLSRVRHCRARWGSVVRSPRAWNRSSQALVLPPRTLLAEEIVPQLESLRRELAPAPELRERAQRVLRELAAAAGRSPPPAPPPVYVGLHVRRTDYPRYLRRTLRARPAPLAFYLEAMRQFERRHREPLFVVVSDEPGWCERRLARGRGGRVALAVGGDAPLDLAVLAQCNHSIFDYGTFGLWGALLAGGEAAVYRVSPRHAAVRVARALPAWRLIPPDRVSATSPPF